MDFLVTGTGRCGTLYVARLLNTAGILCGHESIFTPKGLQHAKFLLNNKNKINISGISTSDKEQWIRRRDIPKINSDSSYMATPYLTSDLLKNTTIIHLVRHPIMVISSFLVDFNYFKKEKPKNIYEKFIYQHLPELRETMSPLKRALVYYDKWNDMISKRDGVILHKIDDKGTKLLNKLGLKYNQDKVYNNTKANSRRNNRKSLTMQDFEKENLDIHIMKLIKKYEF